MTSVNLDINLEEEAKKALAEMMQDIKGSAIKKMVSDAVKAEVKRQVLETVSKDPLLKERITQAAHKALETILADKTQSGSTQLVDAIADVIADRMASGGRGY